MRLRTKFYGLFILTVFLTSMVATSAVSGTSGSIDYMSASYGSSHIKVLDGSYSYLDAGAYGHVSLTLHVDLKQYKGYKLVIVIDQRDNYGNNWLSGGVTGMSYSDWSYVSNYPGTNDITATFDHGHRYGTYSVIGWISFDHYLYGKPSTDHFKITIKVVTSSGAVKAQQTVDVLNTNIVYASYGGCRGCGVV